MTRFRFHVICLAAAAAAMAPTAMAQKAPRPKTQKEAQAVQAMLQAQDPDARIKAADDLVNDFGKTDFKSLAFYIESDAWQQKGDNAKAIAFGEQALQTDPQNFDAEVLLANILANTTRDTDLDKDEKLARSTKYANDAIQGLMTAVKPNPQMTDASWAAYKANDTAQAYQALGSVAIVQKKFDDAVADFQKGVDANPDPLLMIRAGRALLAIKKYDDAIGWFDKAINSPGVPDQIKTIATSDKGRATQMKAQAK
jgi:tetratricopeptide (TPR) repeat protein